MEIETKNASLDTLAVTILALHVSGKQMTQAVFKQLPEGREIDGDSLWGVVRYKIKDSYSLWLVFSSGDRLYRRGLSFGYRKSSYGKQAAKKELELTKKALLKRTESGWGDPDGLAEKVLFLQGQIEDYEEDEKYDADSQQYDEKLSTLQQLFIAV